MNTLERLIARGEAHPGGGIIIDRSYPRDGLCIDCREALELVEDKKVWIITEQDRAATTLLWPSEY